MREIIETTGVGAADVASASEALGGDPPTAYDGPVLVFHTLPHAGSWTCSEGETYTDENVVEDPSPTLIRDAGHAHAAGVIEVTEGLDLDGVQSQEDGEAEYARAQADGRWHEGQEIQAALEQESKDRGEYGVEADVVEMVEEGGEANG